MTGMFPCLLTQLINKNEILKVSESLKAYNDAVDKDFAESNAFDGSTSKPITKYTEGGSLTSIYAMRSLGIDPATGQEILVNRDGSVTYTWNSSEQVVVGNTGPKAQGTFGFNVNYKTSHCTRRLCMSSGGNNITRLVR